MNKDEIKKRLEELGDSNLEETLNLRGKLIKLLKGEIATAKNISVKTALRLELKKELEKHKNHIKKMEDAKEKTFSLPKRVGLKIKEIATTINLFIEKKDIINKAKNALTNTVASSAIVGGISVGLAALTGGPVSLALLASLVPTVSYIGLSNVLRQMVTDTSYTKMLKIDDNKDEIYANARDFGQNYILKNKDFLNLLLLKSKEKDNDKLIELNRSLISCYKDLISKAPNLEIGRALKLELINIMNELKKCYELKKKNYIKDKEKMTPNEFAQLEKDYLILCADLYKEESFLKEAGKQALKNVKVSAVTMYVARIVLSTFFPSLAFENFKDVITPFMLTVINNIVNIGEFKNCLKMKGTKYTDTLIKFNNPELFREITNNKQLAMT